MIQAVVPVVAQLLFKEILWDQGWIWLLMLAMGLATIFEFLSEIIKSARATKAKEPRRKKPSYEIIIRKKIE